MLPITPQRLAGVYEMLRGWPPFSRWKLPPSVDVKFHVAKTPHWHAAWWIEGGKEHIEASEKKHAHLASLIESMAHELIHQHLRTADHGAEFQRIAKAICRRYGFDYGQFMG